MKTWIAGALALMLLGSCESSSAVGGPRPEQNAAGGTGGGGASLFPGACGDCIPVRCAVADASCAVEPTCLDALDCIIACSDENCLSGCSTQFPDGFIAAGLIIGCLADECAAECSGGGTSCTPPGGACETNGECCGFTSVIPEAVCLSDFGACTPTCMAPSECSSNCCVNLADEERYGVCVDAAFCEGS